MDSKYTGDYLTAKYEESYEDPKNLFNANDINIEEDKKDSSKLKDTDLGSKDFSINQTIEKGPDDLKRN